MAVVVSQAQNEIDQLASRGLDIKPHRTRMVKEDLGEKFKADDDPLRLVSLSKTLSGEDSPELWNRGMLAGDGCDPQAADRGATQLYYVARAA